jgi:hypothetical protein
MNALLLLSGDANDKWVDAQEDDALGDEEATDPFICKCRATVEMAEDYPSVLMSDNRI